MMINETSLHPLRVQLNIHPHSQVQLNLSLEKQNQTNESQCWLSMVTIFNWKILIQMKLLNCRSVLIEVAVGMSVLTLILTHSSSPSPSVVHIPLKGQIFWGQTAKNHFWRPFLPKDIYSKEYFFQGHKVASISSRTF